jgi:hypothetical protein
VEVGRVRRPALERLGGDRQHGQRGRPEILFGRAIFDNDGKLLYEGPATGGIGVNGQGPISCVADLDGDGRPELIGGRTAYKTTGTAGVDFAGSVLWNGPATDGFCGVADFNEDGAPEVVLVSSAKLFVLNGQTGATLAQANIPEQRQRRPAQHRRLQRRRRPRHRRRRLARYTVFLFDSGANMLSQLWTAKTEDDSSQVTGSSVFDFDGDGRNEVVYNDEAYIRIYPGVEPECADNPPGPGCDKDMTDAEVLFRDRNSSRTRTEYPVIADVERRLQGQHRVLDQQRQQRLARHRRRHRGVQGQPRQLGLDPPRVEPAHVPHHQFHTPVVIPRCAAVYWIMCTFGQGL